MRCSPLFTKERVGNEDVGSSTRYRAWETATAPTMAGGHHIYLVGYLTITNIKNTDGVKRISPPLRIFSYGQPFVKIKFNHYLYQYFNLFCVKTRR